MSWECLDHTRLRNTGGDKDRPLICFGRDGRKWPRIVVSIYPDYRVEEAIILSVNRKDGPSEWWEECGIPVEVMSRVIEFLKENFPKQNKAE